MKKCSSVDGDKVGILGGRTHTHTQSGKGNWICAVFVENSCWVVEISKCHVLRRDGKPPFHPYPAGFKPSIGSGKGVDIQPLLVWAWAEKSTSVKTGERDKIRMQKEHMSGNRIWKRVAAWILKVEPFWTTRRHWTRGCVPQVLQSFHVISTKAPRFQEIKFREWSLLFPLGASPQ